MRGAVIALVIVSHFLITYYPDFYNRYLFEYASMALAVFFVLSGYGNYSSLQRRFSEQNSLGSVLRGFYLDRGLRIFLPYWLSLLVLTFLPGSEVLQSVNAFSVKAYLGLPVIFWFVTSILQRYIVAPFLYILLRKVRLLPFAILMAIAFSVLYFASIKVVGHGMHVNSIVLAFSYRLMLFCVGVEGGVKRIYRLIRNTRSEVVLKEIDLLAAANYALINTDDPE